MLALLLRVTVRLLYDDAVTVVAAMYDDAAAPGYIACLVLPSSRLAAIPAAPEDTFV